MNENLIIDNWRHFKLSERDFYRLEKPLLVEYEYRHPFGHPSSYAYVQFECKPAEPLIFDSSATWNASLSPDYVAALKCIVCEGIVDELIAGSIRPHRGGSLNLCRIKWDDVGSSKESFYLATKHVMKELIEKGSWTFKTKD